MRYLRLAKMNKAEDSTAYNNIYENLVEKKVRKRYSLNAELAIQRQRDTKPDEFNDYYAFVEQCKAEAKAEMEGA